VLYLFVLMLVNLARRDGVPVDTRRQSRLGFILVAVLLAEVSAILVYSAGRPAPVPVLTEGAALGIAGNTETIGMLLYTDYFIPFEVASMLLLVAMIGAIMLAKKEV
jgi:NADH-quinone oxidoreductase subunit J